jgi:hypothetical protein
MELEQVQNVEPTAEIITFDQLIPLSLVVGRPKKPQWALDIFRSEPLMFWAIKSTPTFKVEITGHNIAVYAAIDTVLLEPHRAYLEKKFEARQRYIYWPLNWDPDGAWKEEPHLTRAEWICYKQLIGELPTPLATPQSTNPKFALNTKRPFIPDNDHADKRPKVDILKKPIAPRPLLHNQAFTPLEREVAKLETGRQNIQISNLEEQLKALKEETRVEIEGLKKDMEVRNNELRECRMELKISEQDRQLLQEKHQQK